MSWMDKHTIKRAVELCLAVYRVTGKFPENEILRSKLRGLSVAIIESAVYKISYPKKRLRVLFLCFDVAKEQNWVDARNFEVLKQEYVRLYSHIAASSSDYSRRSFRNDNSKTPKRLTEKQKNIVDFLKSQSNGASISIIAKAVKKSVRTVVRELKILQDTNFVGKEGKTRDSKFHAI